MAAFPGGGFPGAGFPRDFGAIRGFDAGRRPRTFVYCRETSVIHVRIIHDGSVMLVAMDVGNTDTVIGVYEGDRLLNHWRIVDQGRAHYR